MLKIATFAALAVILSICAPAFGQEGFDVSADRLHGTTTEGREIVVLEGNVRIVHGSTVASADTGYYERQIERVRLLGQVRVLEEGRTISGEEAVYLRREMRVIFPRGVTAEDSVGTLTADAGEYDLETDVLEVSGHVRYSENGRTMMADHALYDRPRGSLRTRGSVTMTDDEYGAALRAAEVLYLREERFGVAVGQPWLEIAERGDRKATSVASDSMELYVDERRAVAVGDVQVIREGSLARAGRADFHDRRDRSVLTDNPRVIEGESALSGDTITVYSADDEVSEVVVTGAARSIYEPPGEERSVLTGESIRLFFDQGELVRMLIEGGATGVFFPVEGDTGQAASRNEVRGLRISLGFREGEATTAEVTGGVNGTYRLKAEEAGTEEGPEPPESEQPEEETVIYDCDSLHYDVPTAIMDLVGSGEIEYKGMRLISEAIRYNSRSHNLYATVEPVLWEGGDKITGSAMIYNLTTQRGAVVSGRTAYEQGLYTGRLIRKTGVNALNVEGGTYTSCDHLDPHYSFTSSRMKLYVNDKVIAKPVILRIRGIPIMALPFFMFPIKKGRHSGLLIPRVEFGFDETKGRFIRNAGYYWAPNDYFDATLWGDYYENSKWIGHFESRYKVRYLLNGSFAGSYSSDLGTGGSRWDLSGSHTQEVGENGKLIVHADFVSDKQYRQDLGENLEEALRRELESDISYSARWEDRSLTVAAERRENLDTDVVTQTLPRFNFQLNRKTLIAPDEDGWHGGTYIQGGASFSNRRNQNPDSETSKQQARVSVGTSTELGLAGRSQSIRSSTILSSVRQGIPQWCSGCTGGSVVNSAGESRLDFIAKFKPFGWINFNPSVTTLAALYDEEISGERYPVKFMYWGGFSANTSVFRTFFPKLGPVRALRHVMTPSISYTHRPDFTEYDGRFWSLPGISGAASESRSASLKLSHRIQAKVRQGGEVRKMNNLLSLDTSTDYDFLYKDRGKVTGFSTIRSNMRFYPSRVVTFDLSFSNEPVHLDFESLNLTTRFSYQGSDPVPPFFFEPNLPEEPVVPEDVRGSQTAVPSAKPWYVNLMYRFTKDFDGGDDTYWMELAAGLNLTRNWRVDYSGRFNLSENEVAYQEYSVYRDLHCWEARFVRRYSAEEWQYYFRINIKAHPEIYAERGLRALSRKY
jgi:lipopolysaccharide assembly outer membrane protein LptD (OstA)